MIVNLDDLVGIGAQWIEHLLKAEFQVVVSFDQFHPLTAVDDRSRTFAPSQFIESLYLQVES